MNILVDTNRYTDFAKNDPSAVSRFLAADLIAVPFVALAELRAGFRNGSLIAQNESRLERFLRNAKVRVLFADDQTTMVYAGIYAQLRRQGTPIPTNDIWIAALAVQHSLPLYTRDRHFDGIQNLICI